MILGRVERYTIQREPEGVVVRMRQEKNALGVAAVALGLLGLILWAINPSDFAAFTWPLWLLAGFAVMLVILSFIAAFWQERVSFTQTELSWRHTFRRNPQRVPLSLPVRLRVSVEPKNDVFDWGPILPGRIDVLLPTEGAGPQFQFQTSQHMDQFLRIVGSAPPIAVEDQRTKRRV